MGILGGRIDRANGRKATEEIEAALAALDALTSRGPAGELESRQPSRGIYGVVGRIAELTEHRGEYGKGVGHERRRRAATG